MAHDGGAVLEGHRFEGTGQLTDLLVVEGVEDGGLRGVVEVAGGGRGGGDGEDGEEGGESKDGGKGEGDTAAFEYGVCLCNVSTGQIQVGQFEDDIQRSRLETVLALHRPVEVVHVQGGSQSDTERVLRATAAPGARFEGLQAGNGNNNFWDATTTLAELDSGVYEFNGGGDGEAEDEDDLSSAPKGWPALLRFMATRGEDGDLEAAGRCELALSALGGCISELRRALVDRDIVTCARVTPYIPADILAASQDVEGAGGAGDGAKGDATMTEASSSSSSSSSSSAPSPGILGAAQAVQAASGDSLELGDGVSDKLLVMDAACLRNLEILQNSHDGGTNGSLISHLDRTRTNFGRRLFRKWLTCPLTDTTAIESRLDAVEVLLSPAMVEKMDLIRTRMMKIPDLDRHMQKVHSMAMKHRSAAAGGDHPAARQIMYEEDIYGKRKVKDFVATLQGFELVLELVESLAEGLEEVMQEQRKKAAEDDSDDDDEAGKAATWSHLLSVLCGVTPCDADAAVLGGPMSSKDAAAATVAAGSGERSKGVAGVTFPLEAMRETMEVFKDKELFDRDKAMRKGEIDPKKGTSAALDEARANIVEIKEDVEDLLKELKQEHRVSMQYIGKGANRYQIETDTSFSAPEDWEYVSGTKSCTRYRTPELKGDITRLEEAEATEEKCLKDIMRSMFEKFIKNREHLSAAVACISALDCLISLAVVSRDCLAEGTACRPNMITDGR